MGVRFFDPYPDVQGAVAITPCNGFEVERYTVALRPHPATTAVSGTETITVRGTSNGVTYLAFTTNALRISEATLGAASVQVSSGKEAITFTLPRVLRRGDKATLCFRIDGTPARGVTAGAGRGVRQRFRVRLDGVPSGRSKRQGASGARPVLA